MTKFLSFIITLDVEGATCGLHDAGRGTAGGILGNKLSDDVFEETEIKKLSVGVRNKAEATRLGHASTAGGLDKRVHTRKIRRRTSGRRGLRWTSGSRGLG